MEIIYLEKVRNFIDSLDLKTAQRVNRMIDLLEDEGSKLRPPFSKKIKNSMFELRIMGDIQVRVLYFYHKDSAVLLHAFHKKTMKIPKYEIQYAIRTMKEYIRN